MSDARHGRAWRQARAAWAEAVNAGLVTCARCGEPIERGQSCDLGHPDDAPHATHGTDAATIARCRPEHRSRTGTCVGNRGAARTARRAANKQRIIDAERGKLW